MILFWILDFGCWISQLSAVSFYTPRDARRDVRKKLFIYGQNERPLPGYLLVENTALKEPVP